MPKAYKKYLDPEGSMQKLRFQYYEKLRNDNQ